ncbi:MAG: Clo7bot family Cys-rich peptide [Lachnospiraceae bacterium]|nr:Clo7bot family Cys-rich peptide [Lachnospiraceae bacterium]
MKIIRKQTGRFEVGFCAQCGGNCDNRCAQQCLSK